FFPLPAGDGGPGDLLLQAMRAGGLMSMVGDHAAPQPRRAGGSAAASDTRRIVSRPVRPAPRDRRDVWSASADTRSSASRWCWALGLGHARRAGHDASG